MTNSWTTLTIQDLLVKGEAEVKTGPFGTQLHASDYVAEGTPVINARNIGFSDIRADKLEFISEETVQRLSSHLLEPGDIVFGRKGTVERHAFIRNKHARWFQGTDCLRLRLKSPSIDPRFVSYSFLTESHKRWMINHSSHGATMTSLNQDIIRRISLRLPPLATQREIVAVLSAHDDLIENNTRRIKILEEMAQALYREWFVHFRLLGHRKTRLVSSSLGQIPQVWEVKPIGEVVETLGGSTPSTKTPEFWESGDVIWFTPSDLTAAGTMFIADSGKKITRLGLEKSSARLFPPYSVMMTSRATIGVVAINTQEACTNQGFITCIPSERLSAYQLYFWIRENREKIISVASGATYKEINRAEFRELPVVLPPVELTRRFVELVGPMGKQIENLQSKNANLRHTRNLLLPKLISGEVSVEPIDAQTTETDHE